MSHNLERLKAHILPLSRSETFEAARAEWSLESVELSNDWDSCPCGQDIKEHCYIHNKHTGSKTYVGNVCIRRFMNIDTGSLFDGLRRIAKDETANPNLAVIEYANERGFLFPNEFGFLMSVKNKRKTSAGQDSWKMKIIRRILHKTVVQRRTK